MAEKAIEGGFHVTFLSFRFNAVSSSITVHHLGAIALWVWLLIDMAEQDPVVTCPLVVSLRARVTSPARSARKVKGEDHEDQ